MLHVENKKTAVFGIYPNVAQAERAADSLVRTRFSSADISVLMPDLQGTKDFAAVGGLVGALAGMGIPEYEAKRYEGRVRSGFVLLSVHCGTSDEISRAEDMLKGTGAQDIASANEGGVVFSC
jgi:hypothetical protein